MKRRLQYKRSALSLNVRPHKVFEAITSLSSNSELYREQGIVNNENQQEQENATQKHNGKNTQEHTKSVNEEWSEDEADVPAGVADSMLTTSDFLKNYERESIHTVMFIANIVMFVLDQSISA